MRVRYMQPTIMNLNGRWRLDDGIDRSETVTDTSTLTVGLNTHGVFIKTLHTGIKLIVWLCPASKESFLNLPDKKNHAYHSRSPRLIRAAETMLSQN